MNDIFIIGAILFGAWTVFSVILFAVAKSEKNEERASDASIAIFCGAIFCIGCIILANGVGIKCENCNTVVTTKYCEQCGERTGITYGDCINCGVYTDKDYCGNCGTYQMSDKESNKKDESNSTKSENKENREPQKENNSFIN